MRNEYHTTFNKACFQYRVEENVVMIEDQMGEVPVTVDALNVFRYIEQELGSLHGKKVIWRDQVGEWDGMEMENGTLQFFPIGCHTVQEAMKRLQQWDESK
jgi:hypothetical protein